MPRWSASLRSPVFHFPPLTNWTTATFHPRAQPRAITPKAADDLPLPWPVLTRTSDLARVMVADCRARRREGRAGRLRGHQRRGQVVGGHRAVPAAGPPGRAGGAVQGAEHGAERGASPPDGGEIGHAQWVQALAAGRRARGGHEPGAAQAHRRADQPGGGDGRRRRRAVGGRLPRGEGGAAAGRAGRAGRPAVAATTWWSARGRAGRPRSTCWPATSPTCRWRRRPGCRRSSWATSSGAACSPRCSGRGPCCPTTCGRACGGS